MINRRCSGTFAIILTRKSIVRTSLQHCRANPGYWILTATFSPRYIASAWKSAICNWYYSYCVLVLVMQSSWVFYQTIQNWNGVNICEINEYIVSGGAPSSSLTTFSISVYETVGAWSNRTRIGCVYSGGSKYVSAVMEMSRWTSIDERYLTCVVLPWWISHHFSEIHVIDALLSENVPHWVDDRATSSIYNRLQ